MATPTSWPDHLKFTCYSPAHTHTSTDSTHTHTDTHRQTQTDRQTDRYTHTHTHTHTLLTCNRWYTQLLSSCRNINLDHSKLWCGWVIDEGIGNSGMFLRSKLSFLGRPHTIGEHLTESVLVPVLLCQSSSHDIVTACHALHYICMWCCVWKKDIKECIGKVKGICMSKDLWLAKLFFWCKWWGVITLRGCKLIQVILNT